MDDSCAVCAEALEWVAYGPCGHRDVCSTCVVRLRFICDDRRCCICKTESSVIFITKALGDYTRMINDFSVLPSELREGRVGSFWYHEDSQAFFDDLEHYKMIKAMCRLSCSVCDKMEEQSNEAPKRKPRLKNIDQLKGHIFHNHKLIMCSLCLEGRKVFICEQKLYTRAQLNQHIRTGDSDVDGSESERGGFMGHPMCDFCRTPFYGDNELYTHMSTEHYTCHICQRQHPGQYDYFKNYDDLEVHFRREHFLCEDEACLAKKFVVFHSEAEMKRHNAKEHGGHMSRSQRNAALQIPTSFRYSRNEQDQCRGRGGGRGGRGRTFRRYTAPDDQLSMAIQASFETSNADSAFHNPPPPSSSSTHAVSNRIETTDFDPLVQPFESSSTTDAEASSKYLEALSIARNIPLEESSFPPLPAAPSGSQQKSNNEGLPNNTMAARLRGKNKVNVLNSAKAFPASSRQPVLSYTGSTQSWPTPSNTQVSSSSTQVHPSPSNAQVSRSSIQSWPTPGNAQVSSSSSQPRPTPSNAQVSSSSTPIKSVKDNGTLPSTYASSAQAWPVMGSLSVKNSVNTSKISHSASAPNLVERNSFGALSSDFPPVSSSSTQMPKLSPSQKMSSVEDAATENKLLVEKIRAALEFDEDKYSAFKMISNEYRQDLIGTRNYIYQVQQFGLFHLVPELARLCPDPQKQRELFEMHQAFSQENGLGKGLKKGKGKEASNTLADSVISTVRELQSSYKPWEEEVEVLSKDGYRAPSKGKSSLVESYVMNNSKSQNNSASGDGGGGGGGSKQKKKTSKFQRVRLGDGSVEAILNLNKSDPDPDPDPMENKNGSETVPVRGVWRNGGGQRLLATKSPRKS